ncbi:MAG: glycogen synthase GlgA [Oscillospiraceae bacterium]|nr:glycogen synthase GlgA [Oscillospiraceae bacterium]
MKKVLFVASESDPFIKTGGLGDIAYSLSKYLNAEGVETSVVIPKYKLIPEEITQDFELIKTFNVPIGWRNQYCGILTDKIGGTTFYLIDNEYYFKREGIYGYFDEAERFAFFDRAVLIMLKEIDYKPDILHCNDWQTGMIPVILKKQYINDPFYSNMKTLFSIHNLLYQGIFSREVLTELLNLPIDLYNGGTVEFYGGVSFMKGGIELADKISTVSKTYAEEIQTPYYGEKLDGLLRWRKQDLIGIENGIDYDFYNPETDSFIYANYGIDTIDKKLENKIKLQKELGLSVNANIPMFSMITRLVRQKGLDLIISIMDKLIQMNIQIVILGSGDRIYEEHFSNLKIYYPNKVTTLIKFDNELAHKIYAASDIFLMPSLSEPCGLGQMIALKYGTIPIVRETGGLKDSVIPYNKYTDEGNGFTFSYYNAQDLHYVIENALQLYYDRKNWVKLMKRAMSADNSWKKSAKEYIKLYDTLCN